MTTLNSTKFQEQFWLLNSLNKESAAYNIPTVFKLDSEPDIVVLEKAINMLIERHEILRTYFIMDNNSVLQKIVPADNIEIKIPIIELDKTNDNPVLAEKVVVEEINASFDLSTAPLCRVKLFRGTSCSYLTIVFHHIIVDLQSKDIFSDELSKIYSALKSGRSLNLPKIKKQYSDFTKWHNEWLIGAEGKKSISKWLNDLPKANTMLNLPFDNERPKLFSFNGRRVYFKLDKELSAQIHDFAQHHVSYSFVVLLTSYAVLLNKLCQQDKIIIGVPLTNRRNEGFQDTFGCFVNIVPIVVDFSGQPKELEIRKQIRQKLLFAHRKQEVPFLSLLDSNTEKRNPSYNPYFQAGFTFEHPMSLSLDGIRTESLPIEKSGTQLDVFLTMWEGDEHFHAYLEYSTDLFASPTAERMKDCFINTVTEIVKGDRELNEISILTNEDKQKIIEWNNTETKIQADICLHHLFEQQVTKAPDQIALKFGTVSLTYKEFNEQANRLAHFLIEKGVKTEDIVGISIYRSIEMLVGIYAILKAGGAYLPIDPVMPKSRLEIMLNDASPKIILTTRNSSSRLANFENKIYIDDILSKPISENYANPLVDVKPDNLAYIIYTSGSTGVPKGSLIEHHSVINRISWMQKKYPLGITDVLLQKTPITFDVSVWELFWWFFNGSTLTILPPNGEKDPLLICKVIEENSVSMIHFVPSMFASFLYMIKDRELADKLVGLRNIFLSGETLFASLVEEFNDLRRKYKLPVLSNLYGPTEATVDVSYYDCPVEGKIDKIYIGKPIYNTKLMVVDKNMNFQPIGVPGELVISGKNLSRGYLNRQQLNKEKFVDLDYFKDELRVYRTGDLVKWTDKGQLDYIGRIDNQVKLRGYRIELGEIEAKILENDAIKSAAVILYAVNDSDKRLAGYIVLKEGAALSEQNLKEFLSQRLPDYMIPAHIIFLDDMPLSANGKISRKSLPEPKIENYETLVSPATKFEKTLSDIWCKAIGLETVGVTNNFFDVGGNSLTAIQIANLINRELNVSINPLTLFQYPNIRELAKYIVGLKDEFEDPAPETSDVERRIRKRSFVNVRDKIK